jgi:hypothetical protein
MTAIFNLNELTVPRFAVHVLTGEKPYVLGIDPLFPSARRGLRAFADWAVSSGRAKWIIDLCPELRHEWDYPTRVNFYDIYAEMEDWQDRYYRFSDVDGLIPEYARAYKIVVCKHASYKRLSLLLINAALAKGPARVYGLACDAVYMLRTYWSRNFAPFVKVMRAPWSLINFAITLAFQVLSIGWVVSRTRLTVSQPQDFFFAADYNEDIRDVDLYQNMSEGGPVLLVQRFHGANVKKHEGLENFATCNQKDGFFGLKNFPGTLAFLIRDSFRLFRHFHDLPSALFYQVAALPFRRAMLRGLFNRYRPKFFWGRDDYNVEHTLRRQELNRVGGKSFGINHGTIVECLVQGEFRYLNFDRYYVFGKGIYSPEMQKHWAGDMKVIPVGSFGAMREDFKLRFKPRPPDILFCAGFFVVLERCMELVRTVAAAFPERRILLQVKPSFANKASGKDFVAACRENLPNIEPVQGPPLRFFPQVQYSFSDPSTTVQEAIQFGLNSFCLDLSTEQKTGIFREFPDLCIATGEEAIKRIKSIETGQWHYPIEKYGDLIDLSGKVFVDKIREDVGLSAKEPAIPLIQDKADQKGLARP